MPSPHPRSDAYGRLRPTLVEVQEAVTFDQPTNQRQRQLLHALIEDACHAVLQQGWYGKVLLSFTVENGIIQADVHAGMDRVWRARRGGHDERP